ncbi:MAG: hypothetical protein AABX05_01730 [Nanoarchaeota archaeon]
MNSKLDKAFDHYHIAEHLFETTLPITKEPKLLLGIIISIGNCLGYAISSILAKEKISIPEGLLKKIDSLRPIAAKYNLSADDLTFMVCIQEIIHLHGKSPMEFKRGSSQVICSEDYDLEVLSSEKVEKYLLHAKQIIYALKTTFE